MDDLGSRSIKGFIRMFALVLLVSAPGRADAQPANDDCAAAAAVGALPFSSALDTALATVGGSDPTSSCGSMPNNVWYSYTATSDVSLSITATGAYDTSVNVYSGSCGTPVEVGCNDDTPLVANDSLVILPLQSGESVLVSVADAAGGGGGGGAVTVTFDEASPPYLDTMTLTEAVSSTDSNPLGGTYAAFEATVALNKKGIAFVGRTDGVFVRDGLTLTTIAVSGDATPLGGTFHTFGKPSINDSGDIAFFATVEGGTADSGIFIYNAGVISPSVVEGDPSPDGGTYVTFQRNVRLEAGAMAYLARTTMSGNFERLFTTDFLTTTIMATEGDPTPCGGTFSRVGTAGGNSRGFDLDDTGTNTVFAANVGGGGDDGFFHSDGVTITAIACDGAPTVVGGTYRSPGDQPAMNGAGDVYFYFGVQGGPIQEAIWKWNAGVTTVEYAAGTVLGSGDTVVDLAGNMWIDATSPGFLAFVAEVNVQNQRALVLAGPGVPGLGTTLVFEGDPCPFGGAHELLDTFAGVSSVGNVSYGASCGGGVGTLSVPFGGAETAAGSGTDVTAIGNGFDFIDPTINAAGAVAFRGTRSASHTIECKNGTCGPITTGVAPQVSVPGVPGQVIHTIHGTSLNGNAKELAFGATTTGASGHIRAVLGIKKGSLLLHAIQGQALPGGVGTFGSFTTDQSQPSQGNGIVAFHAGVSGHPTAFSGLFASTKNGVVTLALEGDLSPTGGVFDTFGAPTARNKSVVFRATTNLDECIYSTKKPGMPLVAVVCDGDVAPPSLGAGTISLDDRAPTGSAKSVVFGANDCIAVATPKGIEAIRCVDQPYIRGAYIEGFDTGSAIGADVPRAESKGKGLLFSIAVFGYFASPNSLIAERKGEFFPVLEEGVTVAPTSGGFLHADGTSVATMSKKTVVFGGAIDLGSANAGVFQAQLD